MKSEFDAVEDFPDWYTSTQVDHKGRLVPRGFTDCARRIVQSFRRFRTEGDARTKDYWKYEKHAAAEVVSEKPDLPNISSGESAGFIRRIARNVVQHTPNVFIANQFDDDSSAGILAKYMLTSKIVGDDEYSNDMQQHLITTARRGFTLGFDAVVPVLVQNSMGQWYMKYDSIHYRDVYPEPGAKDIRQSMEVFVRRYMTKGELIKIVRDQTPGWDISAIKTILGTAPVQRREKDHESRKHATSSDAYEIITYYNSFGDHFLTWEERSSMLLRIEKNKHPLKEHPVLFFLPERDAQQAYGKSILSLTYGRQEFQDLYMNGAMKMFYRNINPPIFAYGSVNGVFNLSPGKVNEVANPNAKVEPFTVDSQSLMMFGQISNQNSAAMISMLGAADQQMASVSTGGMMSQTPQGVEAQQQMVDITTNNYQKAMENFFSKYCSYALTIYFQELKNTKSVTPTADVRKQLINAGIPADDFIHEEQEREVENEDGSIDFVRVPADGSGLKDGTLAVDFSKMAVLYNVQCVPGSLVELEDEKEMRILQQVLVPISQAMPAIQASGDQAALAQTSAAIQYIVRKTIELSGSAHSSEITALFAGETDRAIEMGDRIRLLEEQLGGFESGDVEEKEASLSVLQQLQMQVSALTEAVTALAGTGPQAPASGPGGQPVPSGAPGPVSPALAPA